MCKIISNQAKELSIVVPVFNEAPSLPALCEQIINVAKHLDKFYELIFIDDNSQDGSYKLLRELEIKHSQVIVSRLTENGGQSAAMTAGINLSQGKVIITMDADLQDNPQDIPIFIEKIEQGYDLVCGWRRYRQDNFLFKIMLSKIGNYILRLFTRTNLHDFSCTFKAFNNKAAKAIAGYFFPGFHRFIPLLAKEMNFSFTEIVVNHRRRTYGKSKYHFGKIFDAGVGLILLMFSIKKIRGKRCFQ